MPIISSPPPMDLSSSSLVCDNPYFTEEDYVVPVPPSPIPIISSIFVKIENEQTISTIDEIWSSKKKDDDKTSVHPEAETYYLSREQLQTLKPQGWIHSRVVDMYFNLLQARSNKYVLNYHYVDCQFYDSLMEDHKYNFKGVAKHFKKVNL
jgi:hypothetical protein